ncbi:MFS general substrate transporter [Rhodotorula sp. JG-1b]|nr:MFS general substrate transporter [Rhodotorula sp. JG-1b]
MAVHSHADHPHPHHLAEQIPPIQFESTGLDDNGSETVGRRDSAAGAGLARSSSGDESADTAAEKGESGSPRIGRHDLEKAASLPHAAPPADDFPDGGWRAWSVVAGAWCISFTSWGYSNSFGVFQTYYADHQLSSYTSSDISWIGSFQLAMVLACAFLAGKAFDAGYIKYLLCAALCFYAAGMFGLANATQYWQIFLAQGLSCGLAAGIAFLPAASSVSHWFKRRRATALGFLATGSSIGGIVYPIMQNRMFQSVGFEWTVRAVAFLTITLVGIAALTINSRLPPKKIGNIFDFRPLRERSFVLFIAAESIIMLGLYTPYFYIQDYGRAHGVSPNVTQYSLAILNGASIFGRIIPNWLADTYGPLTILTPQCFISGILMFCFIPMCKTEAGLIVFTILFGFSSGAYVSMMPATTASLTKDMRQLGHRTSLLFLFVSIFALTGTPISGAILSRDPSYKSSLFSSGAFVLVGSVLNAATWWVVSKEKGTRWV